jgi:hypothetical protein
VMPECPSLSRVRGWEHRRDAMFDPFIFWGRCGDNVGDP